MHLEKDSICGTESELGHRRLVQRTVRDQADTSVVHTAQICPSLLGKDGRAFMTCSWRYDTMINVKYQRHKKTEAHSFSISDESPAEP